MRGQTHIGQHGQVGNQVKLLKHHPDVSGPEPVPLATAEGGHRLPEQGYLAPLWQDNARQQVEQAGFSRARGTVQKQALTGRQTEVRNIQYGRVLSGPGKLHITQGDGRSHWGVFVVSVHNPESCCWSC